ncbi:MAG: glucose-1-phosphate thymidylyltransferase [Acidobacteria bacterium]|nr:glucose-1-phosphate thymidylyltransferase [Acidobacteriota bacterium]
MRGLILSGGKGTRLRPLTFTNAKQLVPVANKPVLFYGIEALIQAGITDIGIVVGDTKDEIRGAVGDGAAWGCQVTYIEQEAPLGLAHAVLTAEQFLKDAPFVMYLGDNLIKNGITALVKEFRERGPNAQILLAHVPNPNQFGVAELEDGRVVRLVEKPKQPKSDLALVGVYMFDSHVFDAARAIQPSSRGELEITDAIQRLVDEGLRVEPHVVDGWWKDMGKVEDLLEANRLILETFEQRIEGTVDAESRLEGKVVVDKGAQVIGSVIRGPAIIGSGAVIDHAYVGPYTSVGSGVRIIHSEIEHSIVLEGSAVESINDRIESSLIGRNVRIYKQARKPRAWRFNIGDNSEVGVH